MPRVWVSLGSNIDRERCIRGAVAVLRERYGALVVSSVFESEAVGFEGQPFYNLVVGFDTEEPPGPLSDYFAAIEDAFGRDRRPDKFSPRTLDIDLLTYGELITHSDGIDLPRDEIARYAFVLRPLAEVAGDDVHPEMGFTYRALWESFDCDGQPLWPVQLNLD